VATDDGAPLLVPVNMETVAQAAARSEANTAPPIAPDRQSEGNVVALPRAFREAMRR
jgi:hypothetical protein